MKHSIVLAAALIASMGVVSCSKGAETSTQNNGVDKGPNTTPDKGPDTAPDKSPDTAAVKHPLPGDPVAGKEVYEKVCIACHAKDGRGNGGLTGADFVGDPSRLAKSNEVLFNSIWEGKTDGKIPMPPLKGVLTETAVKDGLSYVRATFGPK